MGPSFHFFFFLFLVVVVAGSSSYGTLPSEQYWHQVLPNIPMPAALKDLIHSGWNDKKTVVSIGGDGIHAIGKGTRVDVGRGGVGVNAGGGRTRVNVGKGGIYVRSNPKKKPVVVTIKPGSNPFYYQYEASEDQIHDDPKLALFFLEKSLQPGTKMNLLFTSAISNSNGATLLPKSIADSIPFSSEKFPEILRLFSLNPKTKTAEILKQTIKECEQPAVKGETRYCASSMESIIDFSTSQLGTTNIRLLTTVIKGKVTQNQEYTITDSGVEKVISRKIVVCHPQSYMYTVMYCHATRSTRAYIVPLVGKDGSEVKAVAVCHQDTSSWNPKHTAFKVLKVKPGTVPVCHFLPQNHLVWVQKDLK